MNLISADRICDELGNIERALREPQSPDRYCQLYAAQQALVWAIDPNAFAAPYATIQRGLVHPITRDIPEGSKGYLARNHPPQSSNICGPDGLQCER